MSKDLASFAKREIALRYWLHGAGFHNALRAMELLKIFEDGNLRKDGVSPVTSHMFEITLFVSRLPGIRFLEEQLIVTLLHDLVEDHGVPIEVIRMLFGERVANAVWNMTKKMPIYAGGEQVDVSWLTPDGSHLVLNKGGRKVGVTERDEDELFAAMAADELASIGKCGDRANNLGSMAGVFTPSKQISYVDFTDERILPMAKIARRRYPHLEPAFVILETVLRTQVRHVRGWATGIAA